LLEKCVEGVFAELVVKVLDVEEVFALSFRAKLQFDINFYK